MTQESKSRTYELPSMPRSGLMLGLSGSQLAGAGVIFLVCIVMMASGGPLILTAFVALVGGGVAAGRWQGESTLAWIGMFVRLGWGSMRGKDKWFARVPLTEVPEAADDASSRSAAAIELPPVLAGLSIMSVPEELAPLSPIGVVLDESKGRATALLRVSGKQFALVSPEEKDRLLDGWGRVLSTFATRRPVVQVSWSAVGTPSGLGEHRAWAAEQGGTGQVGSAVDSYRDLLDATTMGRTSEHEVVAAVTVSRAHLGGRRRPSQQSREMRLMVALVDAIRQMERQLSMAKLSVSSPMTAEEIAGLVRGRIDPTRMRNRRTARAAGSELPEGDPENAGPLAMVDHGAYIEVDGRAVCTYVISEWPGRAQHASWMEPFLRWQGSVERSVTVLFEPIAPRESDRQVQRDLSRLEADAEVKEARKLRVTARHRKEHTDVQVREQELLAGFREAAFAGLVTITADTADELYDAMDDVETHAQNSGLDLRQLWGRQPAAWAASLGIGVSTGRVW
ncbi:MAG: hypothetical protein KDB24_16175 [Microthrixaceae bacterium]|nr:hypothetical protein [Microthrixaceae bacterium]